MKDQEAQAAIDQMRDSINAVFDKHEDMAMRILSRPTYYDREGKPISMLEWAEDYERGESRVVRQEQVGDYFVSTVWMGLDHQFMDGPPLVYETMVFKDDASDLAMDRYSTMDEAIAGHEAMVKRVRAGDVDDR